MPRSGMKDSKESGLNLPLRSPAFPWMEYNSSKRKLDSLDLSGLLP